MRFKYFEIILHEQLFSCLLKLKWCCKSIWCCGRTPF